MSVIDITRNQAYVLALISPLVLLLILMGCSPAKRLAQLQKQHPELFVQDTLVVRDTVVIQADTLERAVGLQALIDSTVVIQDSTFTIEARIDTVLKVLHIRAETKPQTVYLEKEVPVMSPIEYVEVLPKWFKWLMVGVGAFIMLLIMFVFKKYFVP